MEYENQSFKIKQYLEEIRDNMLNGDSFNDKFRTYIKRAPKINWNELLKKTNNKIDVKNFNEEDELIYFTASFLENVKQWREKKGISLNSNKLELTNKEIYYILFHSPRFNFFNWSLTNMIYQLIQEEKNRRGIYDGFPTEFIINSKYKKVKGYELLKWIYNFENRQEAYRKVNSLNKNSEFVPLIKTIEMLGHLIYNCRSSLLTYRIKWAIDDLAKKYRSEGYRLKNIRSLIFFMIKIVIIQMEKISYNKYHIQNPKKIQYKNLWRMKKLAAEKTLWEIQEIKEKKQETWHRNQYDK